MYTQARRTLKLAFPIIFGELAQMALHIIDIAMVGAVDYKQLAAAALVLSVMNIPFVFGIGITIAVSQMVSMAHGKGDDNKVSHYLYNGFWLCLITAVIITVVLLSGTQILFHLNQDPEVAALALPYMKLLSWSVIPMILFLALKSFADGLELTKTAMMLSLLALPVNAFLNWLLIYGNWGFPRLELIGAGWGTLLTRSLIFILLFLVIVYHKKFTKYIALRKEQWKLNWQAQKELLHIGIPSSFQITMEAGAFAISGIIIGTIGAVELAAHQIALSLASITFMASMGLSQAGAIRTSNAKGRNDNLAIREIGKGTLIMALVYGTSCAILFVIFRNQLPLIFNDDEQVVALAAYLLLFAALFQISDSVQVISAGLLRGVKDVKVPTYFIALAYWVIGIPVGYLLTFYFKMGAAGIWMGFIIGLSCSAVFLSLRFKKITDTPKS